MQGVKRKPVAICLLGLLKYTLINLKHSSMLLLIKNNVLANVGTLPLKEILLYNRPHSECRLKYLRILLITSIQICLIWFEASNLISLVENNILAHFGTVLFKEILLHNQPHSGCRSKNPCLLLIRSIQIYFIWYEAFRHNFVDKEWYSDLYRYRNIWSNFAPPSAALSMPLKKPSHFAE